MKYLSVTETAGMVRKALKESFPGVKFSVRSSSYSGGASIRVGWIDGPNSNQVERVAHVFKGAYFDGMIDYKGSTYSMIDGEQVSFGADFIFCNRDYSDASIQRAIDRVYNKYLGNFREHGVEKPTVEQYKKGQLHSVQVLWIGAPYHDDVQSLISACLSKHSDRMSAEKSATASKVIYLGNDGYSQVGAIA
jgi:hypothetical protein